MDLREAHPIRTHRLPILLALLLTAGACTDNPEGSTPPTSASATATTQLPASTTTPGQLGDLTWTRLPDDQAVFGGLGVQEIHSVTTGGPGLVAVGGDGSGGDMDAAVWVSTDGYTWARIPADEAVFGGPGEQAIWSVTAGGPGLVAVGYDSSGDDDDAAVWVSPPLG